MAIKNWKRSYVSDVTGEVQYYKKGGLGDWRLGIRIFKVGDYAYEHCDEWAVTNVKEGTAFSGVDVDTKYFTTKSQALAYAKKYMRTH